nr:hypothetical protein GCM10020063_091920 [Dactylosporangium thailandense]
MLHGILISANPVTKIGEPSRLTCQREDARRTAGPSARARAGMSRRGKGAHAVAAGIGVASGPCGVPSANVP